MVAALLGGLLPTIMTSAAVAQTGAPDTEPRLYGGARLAFTKADVSAGRDYDPRFGIGGGVYAGGTVVGPFDLRVEANYIQKGGNLSLGLWSIEWQLDYLEIPVLAVWNIMPRSRTSVELYAGGAYGIGLHQQVEEGGNLGYDLEDVIGFRIPLEPGFIDVNGEAMPPSSLVIESVETSELSAVFGVGLSVPVGSVNLTFDGRYMIGLTDPVVTATFDHVVGDGEDAFVDSFTEDVSTRVFAFFVGFEFPFGSRGASE